MILNNMIINVNEYFLDKNNNITLIFTHGLGEYSKSYDDVAKRFNKLKYNVITYDIRGHGKSLGKRGYVKSYKDFINDLDELVEYAYTLTKRVYLVGHSMGGLITNIYTSLYNKTDGVIISASPTYKLKDLKLFSLIPSIFTNNLKLKTDYNDRRLTHENNYVKDNYDLDFVYFKLITEVLVKGMKVLNKNFKNYETNALFLYSKADQMVSLNNSNHIYNKIKSKNKKILIYEKTYHNIFSDIEVEKIVKDIDEWISQNEKQ